MVQEMEKLRDVVIKGLVLGPVLKANQDLRADKCLCKEDFPRSDSKTILQKNYYHISCSIE